MILIVGTLNSTPDSPMSLVEWIWLQFNRISAIMVPLAPWFKLKIQWPRIPRYAGDGIHRYLWCLAIHMITLLEVTAVKVGVFSWFEVEVRTTGGSG